MLIAPSVVLGSCVQQADNFPTIAILTLGFSLQPLAPVLRSGILALIGEGRA